MTRTASLKRCIRDIVEAHFEKQSSETRCSCRGAGKRNIARDWRCENIAEVDEK